MSNPTISKPTTEALIIAAFSDVRPDPYHPSPEIKEVINTLWGNPDAACVARFWVEPGDPPEWKPDFADKLESYLYDESESDEAAEQRLEELRNGAPLTEEEKTQYETRYWDWDVIYDTPVYYLLRLTEPQPCSSNGEPSRSVYFLTEHLEMGQNSSQQNEAGPFRSLDEVVEALTDEKRSSLTAALGGPLEFDTSWDEEVTQALKERHAADRRKWFEAFMRRSVQSE